MDRTVRTSLFITALLAGGCASKSEAPKMAPDFVVETVDSPIKKVKLSDLKGKVVLIDFWATWCGPCRESMPAIDRLYKAYKDKGLEVMGISNESRAEIRSYIASNPISYPVYADISMGANVAYKVNAIPRLILVDRTGKIVLDETGWGGETEVGDAIQKAL